MATLDVKDMSGKKVSTLQVSDEVFGIEPNEKAMHAVVVNHLANRRQGTQSTKTRSEVRGGGRKPWRQKGTGRARHGSIRSPIWVSGGVAHGPKPRKYSYRLNRRQRRVALLSALSAKCNAGEIILIDEFDFPDYKTKSVVAMLEALGAGKKALIVSDTVDEKMVKSARNIPGVKTTTADLVNVYDLLNADTFILSVDAIKKIEEVFGA